MRKKSAFTKNIVAAVVLVLLLPLLYFGATLLERASQKKTEQELQSQKSTMRASIWTEDNTVQFGDHLYGIDHRLETYLFIGTDHSGNDDPEHYYGGMADFLLLMVMDHTENTIAYLHIDRNSVTSVRELAEDGTEITSRDLQICTAHWYGRNPEMAAENTVYAVRQMLGGLPEINGYFVMDMDDIGHLNHAVGGVELTRESDPDDPELQGSDTMVLNDEQAVRFLRGRMGVGGGTNAERMVRQRIYMTSLFQKVKEQTFNNPSFGLELWDTLRDVSVSNMNGNAFSRIAQKLLKGTDKGMFTLKGETIMGGVLGDGKEHEEFYADEADIQEQVINLFSMVSIDDGEEDEAEDAEE